MATHDRAVSQRQAMRRRAVPRARLREVPCGRVVGLSVSPEGRSTTGGRYRRTFHMGLRPGRSARGRRRPVGSTPRAVFSLGRRGTVLRVG